MFILIFIFYVSEPDRNVPSRNRIVQVQSEQAAKSGVGRTSTHNREGQPPRVRSYLAYLYCYYSKPYQFVLKENLFFQRSPNPTVNVPIRNRMAQVQSEQAAKSGAVRTSTHKRDIVVALSVAPPLSITETGSAASIVD